MNSDIQYALKKFVSSRQDLFGANGEFLRFVEENEREKSKGFTSTTIFGKVEYSSDGVHKEFGSSLAVKHTRDSAILSEFYSMAAVTNELFFYTKILPFFEQHRSSVGRLFPKFYGNLSVTNSNKIESVSIMENLKAAGYEHFSRGFRLDVEHLSLMMRTVAEFHASSFYAKAADPLGFRVVANALSDIDFMFNHHHCKTTKNIFESSARALARIPKYSKRLNNLDRFFERLKRSLRDALVVDDDDPTLVLCHGDFTAHNVLFRYENGKPVDAKMIDTGHCKLLNPMNDLVRVLFLNASKQTRDEYWDHLIDVYYAALSESYREAPAKERITEGGSKNYMVIAGHAAAGMVPILEGFQNGILDSSSFEITSEEQMKECWKRMNSSAPIEILQDLLERTNI